MCRCSGLMPRAAMCLEGHWVKMRPGAAVMAHPRRRMDVGCHRPRAQRGTSCYAVTGASSAALRGGEECSPPHIFPRTLRPTQHCGKTQRRPAPHASARTQSSRASAAVRRTRPTYTAHQRCQAPPPRTHVVAQTPAVHPRHTCAPRMQERPENTT
jgi:hypothetical protein